MAKNALTSEEIALLSHCLKTHAPELLEKIDELFSDNVNSDIVNAMRDTIGSGLADKVFNQYWSPTPYGLRLEDLIDRLADLYLWLEKKKITSYFPVSFPPDFLLIFSR